MIEMILLRYSLIVYFSSLILILPLIIGGINIKEVKQSPLKVIYTYCILHSIYDILAWVYALNGWRNHFISNTISYTDIIFWGYYFYKIIEVKSLRYALIGLVSIALILVTLSHIGADYNKINSSAQSITNITLITIALMFFYQLLNSLEIGNLFIYPHFWIAVAVLIYFSGIFFINIFAEYITFNKDRTISIYWDIKDYLTFTHRVLLAIGFWFTKTTIQLKNASNSGTR